MSENTATAETKKPKTEVVTVTMDDGTTVDFPGKREMLKTSIINAEAGTVAVRIDWRNGETRTYALPASLLLTAAAHGFEQKLGDETAGMKDTDGKPAHVDDKVIAVDALFERINGGDWNKGRSSDGMAGVSLLVKAMVEVTGKDVAKIKEYVKARSAAERAILEQDAKFKPTIDRLRAERAGSKVSEEQKASMLAELDAIG